ncbi:hypothetical protein MES4922_250002 [Mesorhizobium ventifaucium]|uniref:HTH merR-type domain-containing protein n=2 Tax=Mesorhizobium ventifaucium TaxID=666020 RepID=A0ABM9DUW5_9HYPH|nr:hypothetical protein MES4922_250002 [Mesorhizobium ventifaucium]
MGGFSMTDYSLADLTKITDSKRRSVQLWAEAGVIHADVETERAGTGVHRRFSRNEAIIAVLIARRAELRISIGMLKMLADHYRTLMQRFDVIFEECIAGRMTAYMASYADVGYKAFSTTFHAVDPSISPEKQMQALGAFLQKATDQAGGCHVMRLDRYLAVLR